MTSVTGKKGYNVEPVMEDGAGDGWLKTRWTPVWPETMLISVTGNEEERLKSQL